MYISRVSYKSYLQSLYTKQNILCSNLFGTSKFKEKSEKSHAAIFCTKVQKS